MMYVLQEIKSGNYDKSQEDGLTGSPSEVLFTMDMIITASGYVKYRNSRNVVDLVINDLKFLTGI